MSSYYEDSRKRKYHDDYEERKEKCSFSSSPQEEENKTPADFNPADNPDWFQDALRRAREKAKELAAASSKVSHSASSGCGSSDAAQTSRWATAATPPTTAPAIVPSAHTSFNMPGSIMGMVGQGQHNDAIRGVMVTKLTRDSPAIKTYAKQVFGTLDLTDAQWKQCEEQMKMNIVFQLLHAKKQETERLAQLGKVKYEYDSDEEVDGGTWEHKRRKKEMDETAKWADQLTKMNEGKHHIGDFLPPEELAAFMEKYRALKDGRDPDFSDYRENKITEDNVGYRMLKSMGWTEGTGLGADGSGITAPVTQKPHVENHGLGVATSHSLSAEDDEYEAYRKRMMLAYRFRPNPLNNPRRAYY